MRIAVVLALLAAVGACAPPPDRAAPPGLPPIDDVPAVTDVAFPRASFAAGTTRSNIQMAADFLDLTFALESGGALPGLLRYETPVRVYLTPGPLSDYRADLQNVLARLRSEAGIDIAPVSQAAAANIVIEGVTFRELQRAAPGAACIVKPGETAWASFRRKAPRNQLRWSEQQTLGRSAIFIASDMPPQDIRSCLNEEIAQALGPVNDLYRLPSSVFNDDNTHVILTPFDMLVLRALYSPELRSGMPRQAVAARLPALFDRLNPQGRGRGSLVSAPEDPGWNADIAGALTRLSNDGARLRSATRAIQRAQAMQPADHRLAVALTSRARLIRESSPEAARADFLTAFDILRRTLGENDLRTGQAALHVALGALQRGDLNAALDLADRYIPVATQWQDAILLSSLHGVRSRVLSSLGQEAAAQEARLRYLQWARYAYGDSSGQRRRAQARIERAATQPPS